MRDPLSVILILTTAAVSANIELKVKYEWKYITFIGKNGSPIKCGGNDTNACVLYDVDRAKDGRTFVTAVRELGVQATLSTVSKKMGKGGPLLQPYPNWKWNEYDYNTKPDCDRTIISVYRVSIKCNHIFVLDCGDNWEKKVCPPKLLIFDLKHDELVAHIPIPSNMYNNDSLFVTPLAYVRDCGQIKFATVFMADITGFGLVIYNKKSGFCRIESKYMKPTNTNFTIEDQEFYLDDGILGLTDIYEDLYFADLGGNNIYKMNMCIDRKCSELTEKEANDLTRLAGTLSGQTAAIASKQCAIFFSNIPQTSILCQDTSKEFNSNNTELIAQDSEKLQFTSGMKVSKELDVLMMLTNRFQRFNSDTSNSNETNFRVLTVDIKQVRKETNCFASCKESVHGRPGHGRPGHGRPGHGRPGHGRPGHGRPGHGRPGHGRPGHGRPGYDRPGHDRSRYDRRSYDRSWNRRSWERSNEHDKSSDEHDEHSKQNEHDKHHEHDKYDKDDKHDKNDKYDKYDKKDF